MYNGIGLSTARGSATSGHITKNLSYVRPDFYRKKVSENAGGRGDVAENDKLLRVQGDKDILDHKRKRQVEAEIFELQEEMMEEGYTEEEVAFKVKELRRRLEYGTSLGSHNKKTPILESHELAKRQEQKNKRMRSAFGLSTDKDKEENETERNDRRRAERRLLEDGEPDSRRRGRDSDRDHDRSRPERTEEPAEDREPDSRRRGRDSDRDHDRSRQERIEQPTEDREPDSRRRGRDSNKDHDRSRPERTEAPAEDREHDSRRRRRRSDERE